MTLPQEPCPTQIRVVASPRRRRTVSARLVDGVIELRVPSWMSESERASWAERMRNRIEHQIGRAQPSDRVLEGRAQALNQRHFDGRLSWSSIAFAEQQHRWGSCSWTAGVIRISSRAALLPAFVRDYLLMHEMAHLEVPDHSERFWQLVYSYPQTERARGYLMALDHQSSRVKGRQPTG
ncbi:MAG TPA: M48 family metallopeptidase [Candidatus Acidoferrales bacterium]|nr:M48 family metallopeptidase [Candidatus Acidoferrales bacterium]